jgi:hypothetical protein
VEESRGDWIVAAPVQAPVAHDDFDTPTAQPAWPSSRSLSATVAWMDNEPLVPGRVYWALHGHRWVKAKAQRVVHRLNVNTLAEEDAAQLEPNAIGVVEFALQEAIPTAAFHRSRALGSLILVDTASNASLGSGKHVIAPFAFWSIDLPAAKSVFFPYVQHGRSVGGDGSREAVNYTNLRTSLLTRWPSRTYSFVEVSYWFDHERSNRYSSSVKAEVGRFFLPKTGFYLRPGGGMSGTENHLGMKWSMEIGMRHFF